MGSPTSIARNQVLRWSGKAFWATLDQGLFAGSNFVLNILLARWLSYSQYGTFTISYAVFLILGVLHTSLVTEPMLVFGAGRYSASFSTYYRLLQRLHWKLVTAIGLITAIVAASLSHFGIGELANAFWGLSLGMPAILLLWLFRRIFYIVFSPMYSAQGGLAYGVLSLSMVYAFHTWEYLTPLSAFIAIALASLIVSLAFHFLLSSRLHDQAMARPARIEGEHWRYGRWILPSALITWIPGNAAYFILSMSGNMEGGATYRALMNLQMPVLHINTALGLLIIPYLSRIAQSGDYLRFHKTIRIFVGLLAGFSMLYGLFLWLANVQIMDVLYAGKFSDSASLVPVLSIFLVFAAFSAIMSTALRCLQATRRVLNATGIGAVASLGLGVWLIPTMNVRGAIFSMIVSSCCEAGMMVWMYQKALPRHPV
jgi:O-antigen/teichoic acid export membrane protein